MTTFRDYIKTFAGINHRFGDLADDIAHDDSFPDSTDFQENLQHLQNAGASSNCINTFCDAWGFYRRYPSDPTAIYIAMLMARIENLTAVNARIADSIEALSDSLSDIEDLCDSIISISDAIDDLANASDTMNKRQGTSEA